MVDDDFVIVFRELVVLMMRKIGQQYLFKFCVIKIAINKSYILQTCSVSHFKSKFNKVFIRISICNTHRSDHTFLPLTTKYNN